MCLHISANERRSEMKWSAFPVRSPRRKVSGSPKVSRFPCYLIKGPAYTGGPFSYAVSNTCYCGGNTWLNCWRACSNASPAQLSALIAQPRARSDSMSAIAASVFSALTLFPESRLYSLFVRLMISFSYLLTNCTMDQHR